MAITLGEMLKHRHIKQVDVFEKIKNKYKIAICQSSFNRMCHKEGDWFSKKTEGIHECIKKEYGIYYDGSVWRGGI